MSQTLYYTTSRLHRLAAQLRHLPQTLKLVWRAARHWTIIWVLLLVTQGLLPVATVYLTRAVINVSLAAVRSRGEWVTIQHTAVLAAALALVVLSAQLLRSLTSWVRTAQSELVQDHIAGLIHRKSVEADIEFYESPDFYDHLHRARAEATYRPVTLIENLGSLVQNGITLVAMAAVLIPFGPILPLALLISTVPALIVVLRYSHQRHQWRQATTVDERRCWYYDWLLTAGENAAEIRLFCLGDHFHKAYQALRARLRNERLTLARRQGAGEIWAGITSLLITGASLAWVGWRAIRGAISLGDFALFYQAFNQGLGLARSLLENVGQLYENTLFLGNLYEFLGLKTQVVSPARPAELAPETPHCLSFRDVSFKYPGNERFALKHFNLEIAPGQTVAIVGHNGAGKSTLLKLLCRFYNPECGEIYIGDTRLRDLSLEQLRANISVLFQKPVQFNTTVAENIAYGLLVSGDRTRRHIQNAAVCAGADPVITSLPQGYDTQLGRWFGDGTELSVGEWQRIALARAFLRPSKILILDEPTSAMDPWAEIEFAERFRQFARGRIGIIITHRFTTAMFADIIHVMSAGHIIESGSHDELVSAGGLYAEGWAGQVRG